MFRWVGLVGHLACLCASGAMAQTALEQRLAQENPCSGVRHEADLGLFTVTLALDRTDDMRLGDVAVTISGDLAQLTAEGGVTCRTGPGADLDLDASVDARVELSLTLTDCAVTRFAITNRRFGGDVGRAIEQVWDVFDTDIRAAVVAEVERTCRDLMDGS